MAQCMISALQPEAVEAGLRIFENGGNVMDAAIGAAMVQTVVDPQMCELLDLAPCKSVSRFRRKPFHRFSRKGAYIGYAKYVGRYY